MTSISDDVSLPCLTRTAVERFKDSARGNALKNPLSPYFHRPSNFGPLDRNAKSFANSGSISLTGRLPRPAFSGLRDPEKPSNHQNSLQQPRRKRNPQSGNQGRVIVSGPGAGR